MKVLVTDGTFKHSLAAVRALGRLGYEVDVLSHRRGASAAHSRYCRRSFVGPSPGQSDRFASYLKGLLDSNRYQVLLPMGYLATRAVSQHREALAKTARFLLPTRDNFEIAADKNKTIQHAVSVGVPAPRTYWPSTVDDLPEVAKTCRFPLVIKPPYESGDVFYVNNDAELSAQFEKLTAEKGAETPPFMVQEYVQGEGYGFFALFRKGETCAEFMHHRLLEYPVTGGPSVKAESVHDPRLSELGTRLLTSLQWNGIAMVEFKRDEVTMDYKLMEINPKFWGSLDLAISSGVNFPELYCLAAMEEEIPPRPPYKVGLQFRWMVRESLLYTLAHPTKIGGWILDGLNSQVSTDLDRSDWHPHILQLGAAAAEAVVRAARGTLLTPHGRPQFKRVSN